MKKLSKYIMTFSIVFSVFLLTACGNSENSTKENASNSIGASEQPLVVSSEEIEGLEKMTCTREGEISNGEANLSYDLYYDGDYLLVLHAMEEVISSDESVLDEYETAYKTIRENYKGLKYYDNAVVRTSNSVTNDTIINYGKIDTDRLLEIEGEEDNVIKDGKVKVEDWKALAEKVGTKCE